MIWLNSDRYLDCRSAKSSRQQTRVLLQVLQQAVKINWVPQRRLQVSPGHINFSHQ